MAKDNNVVPLRKWSRKQMNALIRAHTKKGYRCIPIARKRTVPGCTYKNGERYPVNHPAWDKADSIGCILPFGVMLIDQDTPEGDEVAATEAEVCAELGFVDIEESLVQRHPVLPSRHYLFAVDKDVPFSSPSNWMPCWDIKAAGSMIFLSPDKELICGELPSPGELVMLHAAVQDRLPKKAMDREAMCEPLMEVLEEDPIAVGERERLCADLAMTGEGGRNDRLNIITLQLLSMAYGGQLDVKKTTAEICEAAGQCGLAEQEVRATVNSAGRKARTQPQVAIDPLEGLDPLDDVSDDSGDDSKSDDWKKKLIRNSKGMLQPGSITNALLMLTHHPAMVGSEGGMLAYNLLSNSAEVAGCCPWTDNKEPTPRTLSDTDDTGAAAWLEGIGVKISVANAHNALVYVAKRNQYDPLVDYLEGLEWDGVSRIDLWLSNYLGVGDGLYERAVSRRFMISAIARAMRPGCKVDTMLILEGPQGIKKSTAIEALFSAAWFTDELDDLGSKDSAMQMQGVWCVEMSELTNLSRAEANRAKEWISRRIDRFRPPYGRNVISAPRRSVIVGTVNPGGTGYLKDQTGGRRYWPVVCADEELDVEGLRAIRDQLWAEALHCFQAGERWWLEGKENELAKEMQAERYDDDSWTDAVLTFCEEYEQVTSALVLELALGVDLSKQTKSAQIRVGKILSASGRWKRMRRQENGTRSYFYVKK